MILNYLYIMLEFKSTKHYFRVMTFNSLLFCILSICYNHNIIIKPIEAVNSNNLLDLSQYESKCFNCIRNVSSQLAMSDVTKRCENYYCGPYQISYTYWTEAGKPGNNQSSKDFEKCTRDKNCAEQTVRAYFKKFKRDCNNDGSIDCLDMAALHKAGPISCSSDWFYKSRYWVAFNKTNCMTNTNENPQSLTSEISEQEQYDSFNLRQQQHQQSSKIMKNQTLTNDCLDCICDAVSGCNTSVSNCGSGAVCGPFAISQAYWKDGRRPGASWTACSRTKECSSVTIRNYMEKYKRDCNDDGYITCEDYAAIHRRGPRACTNKDLFKDHYWNKFLSCRANQLPSKDVNMVKVHENSPPDEQFIVLQQQTSSTSAPKQQTTTTMQSPVTQATTLALASTSYNHKVPSNQQQQSASTTIHSASTSSPNSLASNLEEQNHSKNINTNNVGYHNNHQKQSSNRYEYSQTPSYAELTSMKVDDNYSNKYNQRQQPTIKPQIQNLNNEYYDNANRINNHQHQQQPETSSLDNNLKLPYQQHTTIFESTRQKQHHHQQYPDYQLPLILVKAPSSSTSWSSSSTPTTTTTTTTTQQIPKSTTTSTTTTTVETSTPTITTTSSTLLISHTNNNNAEHSVSQLDRTKQQATDSMHPIHATNEPVSSTQSASSSSSSSVASNQPTYQAGLNLDNNHEESSNVEYPIASEFPNVNGGVPVNDRFSSSAFDVVVTNIVGNPDFSKSYPPIPELLPHSETDINKQADNNSNNNNNNEQQQPIKSQQIYNTNHSNSPNQSISSQLNRAEQQKNTNNKSNNDQQRQQGSMQSDSSSATTTLNNNNNPMHQRSTVQQQQSNVETNNQQQQTASNPVYDLSINMTSIFEKSLNETNTRIASECLECICDASSNCDTSVQCISKQREKNRCGLYMISWNQYQESDILLTSLIQTPLGMSEESADEKIYYECTTDRLCAERLIHLYIEKHQKDCNNDGKIDCYDIAAIHRVGPENCNSSKFLSSQYWKDFNICYTTDRLTTTVQPQQASSSSSSTSSSTMLLYR